MFDVFDAIQHHIAKWSPGLSRTTLDALGKMFRP